MGKQRRRCEGGFGRSWDFPYPTAYPRQGQPSSPSHRRLSILASLFPPASWVSLISKTSFLSASWNLFTVHTPLAFPPTRPLPCVRVHGKIRQFETNGATEFSGTGTGWQAISPRHLSALPPRSFSRLPPSSCAPVRSFFSICPQAKPFLLSGWSG